MSEPLFPPVPPHECGPRCETHHGGIKLVDEIGGKPPEPVVIPTFVTEDPVEVAVRLLRRCNEAHNGLEPYPLHEVTDYLCIYGKVYP